MNKVLEKINNPSDLKKLTGDELNILADDIREALLNRVSNIGGHVGPNLGMVEATIALHYVFNSPIDKFVFDVSHQSYPHKILTGRKHGYTNIEDLDKVSGYTDPNESEHDMFKIGHTSTSISLACGLAKARDLKGDTGNVVAIIGDGSLSGGEAYEGLNNASELDSNIIILVNDNDMSIAPNYGGIYKNLKELRDTNGKSENNFFKAIGFDYYYVGEGNNIETLIEVFKNVKDKNHPIVIHMNTLKGKGLSYAETNKEQWHWNLPFDIETGKSKLDMSSFGKSYQDLTREYLTMKAEEDKSVIVITPAVPGICGFNPEFREKLGKQYVDVGIAEEHAVAFASGLAKNGAKPVIGMHSSFVQRTYDQLSQDLAINNNPAVILIFGNGISSMDETHLGVFDMSMISNIPNIVFLSPTCSNEYVSMLDWAIDQNQSPVVIRVPNDRVVEKEIEILEDYSNLNKYSVEKEGKEVAILALGKFYSLGEKVIEELKQNHNISATLINPRYVSGVDVELLENLKNNHKLVLTIEDGILDGGFGEKVTRFYGTSNMKVLNYGASKEFTDSIKLDVLYNKYHLTSELIIDDILKNI